jgi:uncharacterized membrane protein YphA (DoxX/SURF4 family)
MKKGILLISRVLGGSIFIISGLVKANDTVGFGIKMEEYFSADVLNLEFLIPLALPIAVFMCIAEIVLGLALLAGLLIRVSSLFSLLLVVFFGFLTFYSAYFNKVTDCGCFGDAIQFTPWQSFIKDMVLMAFVLPVFYWRKTIRMNNVPQNLVYFGLSLLYIALFSFYILDWIFPVFFAVVLYGITLVLTAAVRGSMAEWLTVAMGAILSLIFSYYTYSHLPVKDYRPYAIGKSIPDQMVIPEGEHPDIFKTSFVYKNVNTGVEETFDQSNYPWNDSNWVWVSTDNILVEKGYEPPVHDFVISDADGYEIQDDILYSDAYVFLFICYDVTHTHTSRLSFINDFAKQAEENGNYIYGLTSSLYDQLEPWRHEHQLGIPFYTADETMLKTVIRANPGIVLLKHGVVLAKWHYNDLPTYAEVEKTLMQ